ncbi:MAG: histidine--tRNA ligase [Gammaproteobacteria bacterium]|nr:histidine--tRNA ligase [Gammaproteobacteria bacterium]
MNRLQHPRGMPDLLPADAPLWRHIEHTVIDVVRRYGYQEFRPPLVEHVEVFKRSVGEVTDIVQKEMYVFEDRGGDQLALRPEGTAGLIRAGIQHGLLYNQRQRFWYHGPMFRYERPQRGRVRQHHQIGAEAIGFAGPQLDIEILAMTARFWDALGFTQKPSLSLNSLGTPASRQRFREQLIAFLRDHKANLDEDSQDRIERNPLRVLDSKVQSTQDILQQAPRLHDFFDDESQEHFDAVQTGLKLLDIDFEINPNLVRGLDYYSHTVFEWTTDQLGAQSTVCGGGRYDGLVEQLGGKATPAVGFGMGLERIIELFKVQNLPMPTTMSMLSWVVVGDAAEVAYWPLSEKLRDLNNAFGQIGPAGGSFKSQMKYADRSGAELALILGDDEAANQEVSIKELRNDVEQFQVGFNDLAAKIAERFKK